MHMKSTGQLVSPSVVLLFFIHIYFKTKAIIFCLLKDAVDNVYFYSLDLINFDDIASSESLLHLTANRPKMPGRRLPGRFNGGHSVSYWGKDSRI